MFRGLCVSTEGLLTIAFSLVSVVSILEVGLVCFVDRNTYWYRNIDTGKNTVINTIGDALAVRLAMQLAIMGSNRASTQEQQMLASESSSFIDFTNSL